MAKLKIYTFPDLVLTQKAKPIERIDKSYYQLADDMLETMYDAPGIGLAANQVGILERIIVIDVDFELEDNPSAGVEGEIVGGIITKKNPRIILNPEIIHKEGKLLYNEGCLSVPEYEAEVQRSKRITLQYQNLDGLTQTLDAEGILAVAIQHEMDHLEGKLFIDRLSPLKKEMAQKKLRKEREEREFLAQASRLTPPSKKKEF